MSAAQKVDVVALAKRAGIHPGRLINVVFTTSFEPMFRELTGVQVEKRHRCEWLIWRWDPAGQTPWGTADCGFAGNRIDDDFIAELSALARIGGDV